MRKFWGDVRGMTLIEIMVVITILGLIATVVTVNVMDSLDEAKQKTAMSQIKVFEEALEHFRRDNGYYPSTEQGLAALVERPTIGRLPKRYPLTAISKGEGFLRIHSGATISTFSQANRDIPMRFILLAPTARKAGKGLMPI